MTAGVRDIYCPGLVRGAQWAVRVPKSCDLVPDDFFAWLFSAWEREPSFYWGLKGPSLHSVHQGGITYRGGLRPEDRDQNFNGCSPQNPLSVRIEPPWTVGITCRLSDPPSD